MKQSNMTNARQGPDLNRSDLLTAAAGVLYFLAVCLNAYNTVKVLSLVLCAAVVLACALRWRVLRQRVGVVLAALALYVLMDGVSTFYALSGKFALHEFLKVYNAFCLVLLLTALAPRQETAPERRAAAVLTLCAALSSLVSIDLLSTRWISGAVLGFLGLFTDDFTQLAGVEAGVRMVSLFENPNVFAGHVGIGVLLGLGLAGTEERPRMRFFLLCQLYLNALGFLLAFSMGASAFIAAAFLILLLLERRESRGGMLILMLETLLPVAVSAALISATSFQPWTGARPVPLLCAVLGAAALCLLDRFAGRRLAAALRERGKAVAALIALVLALAAAYIAAALLLTGPSSMTPGVGLRRAAYPEPGVYTLLTDSSVPVQVRVESQDRQQTMMHTETVLYRGDAQGATFTVPEDSLVVYFDFSVSEPGTLRSVTVQSAQTQWYHTLPLHYRLLPGFIANRLQGIWANENAIQRLVFFEDGMKLFRRSPVVGLGMGSFENGIKSVQSFYYETRYAHDHYIQALVDTGLLGLLLFVCLLLVSLFSVWFGRDQTPLFPALGAALVFMAGHAVVELDFSHYSYLPLGFGVFALVNLCCGNTLPRPKLKRAAQTAAAALSVLCLVAYGVLVLGNLAAARKMAGDPTLQTAEQAIRLDKFEWADYMLGYVNSVGNSNEELDAAITEKADEYAARLAKLDSNTVPYYLTVYYFNTDQPDLAFDMAERYVNYVSSDANAWNQIFEVLRFFDPEREWYAAQSRRIIRALDAHNAGSMERIALSPENELFVSTYR